jgi:hypothetical protein
LASSPTRSTSSRFSRLAILGRCASSRPSSRQIHGQGERRSYFYAHLTRPAPVRRGDRVWAGRRIGAVGKTGNARTVGCHLHFEIHARGRPIDPEPILVRWDRYG